MRLMAEASVLLGAATETTTRTLSVTVLYLMKHSDIDDKLGERLETLLPTTITHVSLPQLEALPYLVSIIPVLSSHTPTDVLLQTAVINEGLRCAHSVSSRQTRIATSEDLQYSSYTMSRGTPITQSAYLLHTDPRIFSDPLSFRPERWLEDQNLHATPSSLGAEAAIISA
jgi:cytochrome P450